MIRSCTGLVLIAMIQMIFGQTGLPNPEDMKLSGDLKDFGYFHPYQDRIPRHCWTAPRHIDIFKCCPVPRLYSDELLDKCGVEKIEKVDRRNPPRPKTPPKDPCKDGICLMTNANLLLTNGSVNYEKLRTYVDQWAHANPDFTEEILIAKKKCAKDGGPKGPDVCEQDRVYLCLTASIVWNCKLRPLEGCDELRAHMDECRPYYAKPKDQE